MRYAYVKVTLAALLGALGCSADAVGANTIWASTAVPTVADVGADSPVGHGRGTDPSTLSGLPASIVSDLKPYIYVNIDGQAARKAAAPTSGRINTRLTRPLYMECVTHMQESSAFQDG